jgi:hypothetical protein
MNKIPVTELQRLLHVLAIHFAIIDSAPLSTFKFCNSYIKFDFLTKKSFIYIEKIKHPERVSVWSCVQFYF